ncbi:MAG: Hsp20/alpha crystallin family protein [Chitinophagales bacterium]|nr:Hsp20/alpha crystallin family protein [Chitinophagales bacterium]MDW8418677.1 Hsp20/alpha crystallin family protein [Chitinophagales bacterium]
MTLVTVKPDTGRLTFPSISSFIDSFFESEFPTFAHREFFKTPALVNIKDTNDSYVIEVAAPGFKKEDFSVKVEGNLLNISAVTKNETEMSDEKYTRREFNMSSFTRSFTLPKTVETTRISGAYENGILKITLPKREEAKNGTAFEVTIS